MSYTVSISGHSGSATGEEIKAKAQEALNLLAEVGATYASVSGSDGNG